MQKPLAAVARTFPLHDIPLIHQLLEDPAERLLGDAQKLEQVRDLHARVAIDKMEQAMMCASEAEFGEHLVRVADEVPIGEKEELDQVPDRLGRRGVRRSPGLDCSHIYVSHVDIFQNDCYAITRPRERIVRSSTRDVGADPCLACLSCGAVL